MHSATGERILSQGCQLEIVNMMVPGKNDDMLRVRIMCKWIHNELGPGTPLHFSRFYPRYKLKSIPPTPVSTLERARDVAIDEGLHFVYIGNVPEHPGGHTYCPNCKQKLIHRIGYWVKAVNLDHGKCQNCGRGIGGIWEL